MKKKTEEERQRVHVSIYVPLKLKHFLQMEAMRQNTYIKYVVAEYLLVAMKWKKEADIELKQKHGSDASQEAVELESIKGYIADIHKEKILNLKKY